MSNNQTIYTAAQLERVQKIVNWMEEQSMSQAAMGRLANMKAGTLSQVINAKYPTDPERFIAQLESAIENHRRPVADGQPIETCVFKLVHTACVTARTNRNFAVVSAYVGTGKTFAAKHYSNKDSNVHFVEADPTTTVGVLVDALMKSLKLTDVKTVAAKYDAVVQSLRNTNSLLIIDEADTLTKKVLEVVRRIRDKANIGVVLVGTEYLTALIQPEHGQFDQIRSRVGFWPNTVQAVTPEDCRAAILSQFPEADDAVIGRMYDYSKGSMRMLMEGILTAIETYRKDNPLSVSLVDSIAQQALTLKPL